MKSSLFFIHLPPLRFLIFLSTGSGALYPELGAFAGTCSIALYPELGAFGCTCHVVCWTVEAAPFLWSPALFCICELLLSSAQPPQGSFSLSWCLPLASCAGQLASFFPILLDFGRCVVRPDDHADKALLCSSFSANLLKSCSPRSSCHRIFHQPCLPRD